MRELLNKMHTWMAAYMKTFYTDDAEVMRGIKIKEEHTGYVTTNCIELAKNLNLNAHDVELAEIIGLFHDVGRFYQYQHYRTFNDAESEDHAKLAFKVIDELDFFKKLDAADYDLIHFAIQNHNKRTIEPNDDKRKILFAKLIRDADKLDVYRVLEPYFAQESADKMPTFVKSRAPGISPDFLEKFVRGEQVNYNEIRTYGDRKLVRLMWIYDINFKWTMKKIVERGYIDKIVENLPQSERVAEGVARLRRHVDEVLRGDSNGNAGSQSSNAERFNAD